MDSERERLNRFLDGELDPEERNALLRELEEDPELRGRYLELHDAVRTAELSEAPPPPPGLAAEILRRLPERRPSLPQRLRAFLFGERVLRWNLAAAGAALALLVAVAVSVMQFAAPRTTGQASMPGRTITVQFRFFAPQASSVAVAGEFNRWRPEATALRKQNGGTWVADIRLQPGTYVYMFVVDGSTWVPDPDADAYRDDGFGYRNSVKQVYDL